MATRALKRKSSNTGIIINGPINGGTINYTVNNDIFVQIDDDEEQESGNAENLDEHVCNRSKFFYEKV